MARLRAIGSPSSSSSSAKKDNQSCALESSMSASVASPTPASSIQDHGSQADEAKSDATRRRSGRVQPSSFSYNENALANVVSKARQAPRKSIDAATRNVSGATLVGGNDTEEKNHKVLQDGIKALDVDWSVLPRRALADDTEPSQSQRRMSVRRQLGAAASSAAEAVSNLGKRSRDVFESAKGTVKASVPERRRSTREPAAKRVLMAPEKLAEEKEKEEDEEPTTETPAVTQPKFSRFPNLKPVLTMQDKARLASEKQAKADPRNKTFRDQGIYAGSTRNFNPTQKGTSKVKKQADELAELDHTWLPLPMGPGATRLFEQGRDFTLPYSILKPLPTDEAPKEWRRLNTNRFIGDASANWRKSFKSLPTSLCDCTAGTGCSDPEDRESCINRALQYECNDDNCAVGPEKCQNRAFEELRKRSQCKNEFRNPDRKEPNMFSEGIEVFRTETRGHGVRAMRSFKPEQVIVEYCGEIITQDEADRRMNEEYKDKNNYYLMTFHDGLIIDATRGSICRFVNHSCEPNCRVEKWLVNGEPRMALFANHKGLGLGEELTYDYNFAPFDEENVQKCYCGTPSCRGVIGPRPANERSKVSKVVHVAVNAVKGVKRRVAKAFGADDSDSDATLSPQKKQKRTVADPRSLLSKVKRQITGGSIAPLAPAVSTKVINVEMQNKLKADRASRVARRATIAEPASVSPVKKETKKLQRHSTVALRIPSPSPSPDPSPRRTSRVVNHKYIRSSAARQLEDEEAKAKARSPAKSASEKRTSGASDSSSTKENASPVKRVRSTIKKGVNAVLDVATKAGTAALTEATSTLSRSSSTQALIPRSDSEKSLASMRQSRLSFGTKGLGLKNKSTSRSPQKKSLTASVRLPATKGNKLTKPSPRKRNPSLPLKPSESKDLSNSKSFEISSPKAQEKTKRPATARPGTSATLSGVRPTTAHSVANSMRGAVVRSVKGPARAAAIARLGLKGDDALRKTIRQVSGAEA